MHGPHLLADQRGQGAQPDPALAALAASGRELAVTACSFGAVALVLLITGLRMHAGPRALLPPSDRLDLLVLMPLALGAFLGGPLVAREITQGTATFAWTQGVTRRRWAACSCCGSERRWRWARSRSG